MSGNLLDPRKPGSSRTHSLSTESPESDSGGHEASRKGGFSLLGPLKLYKG